MTATIAVVAPPTLRELFFPQPLWDELAALGDLRLPADDADLSDPGVLAELIGPAEVAVTSWPTGRLDAAVLDATPRLRLVAHTGATVKFFVTEALWQRGVRVTQAGEAMAYAVGEQAFALTLGLLHGVHRFDHALRAGQSWAAALAAPPRRELRGAQVCVVGASRTGRAYIDLVRAVGAEVTVVDPFLRADEVRVAGLRQADLATGLSGADVVSLHAPVLPETRGMIGAAEFALIPDGGLFVNTARSALVDSAALLAELRSGRLDAAIDVFDEEPLPLDDPLRELSNVFLTPHQAAGTEQARRRGGSIVIGEIARFVAGEPLRHEVRPAQLGRMG